ncbi:hypothetical protein ACCO45_004961 [Purpureocillium lilacinum]|uniref:Uncharacterized protein n=1 Tax=Purpureocillium lilacinum TaxID=33203 RepID=A0ACC4DVB1_PURLI
MTLGGTRLIQRLTSRSTDRTRRVPVRYEYPASVSRFETPQGRAGDTSAGPWEKGAVSSSSHVKISVRGVHS